MQTKVKEILMTKGPHVHHIKPQQLIREAARLMAEHNIGILPVVNDANKLLGLISERDIVREAVYSDGPLFDKTVKSIMTTNIIVATSDDELASLIEAMLTKNFRHLPVIDDEGLLIGVLSIKDILKTLRTLYEGEIHHLSYYLPDTPEGEVS